MSNHVFYFASIDLTNACDKYKDLLLSIANGEASNGANVEPINDYLWSARTNKKNRFLFARVPGGILVLDHMEDHDYDKAEKKWALLLKSLKKNPGLLHELTPQQEEVFENQYDAHPNVPPKMQRVHVYGDELQILNEEQALILNATEKNPHSVLMKGSPGSGKTSLTFAILIDYLNQHADDVEKKVLFTTHSAKLIAHIQEIWDQHPQYEKFKDRLIIRSYADLLRERMGFRENNVTEGSAKWKIFNAKNQVIKEKAFEAFCEWLNESASGQSVRNRLNIAKVDKNKNVFLAEKLYREFLIISGYQDDLEGYKKLGERQCFYQKEDRNKCHQDYQKFLAYLDEKKWIVPEFTALPILDNENNPLPTFDRVGGDEIHDFSGEQLNGFLRLAKEDGLQVMSFDPKQNLRESVDKEGYIKGLFEKHKKFLKLYELHVSYRCSRQVMKLADEVERWIKLCLPSNRAFSSQNEVSACQEKGRVEWVSSEDLLKSKDEVNDRWVMIVSESTTEAERDQLGRAYGFTYVMTPMMVKGLSFENVLLYDLLRDEKFQNINTFLKEARKAQTQEEELAFNAATGFYVAITRAEKKVCIYQPRAHQIDALVERLEAIVKEPTVEASKGKKAEEGISPPNAPRPEISREARLSNLKKICQQLLESNYSGNLQEVKNTVSRFFEKEPHLLQPGQSIDDWMASQGLGWDISAEEKQREEAHVSNAKDKKKRRKNKTSGNNIKDKDKDKDISGHQPTDTPSVSASIASPASTASSSPSAVAPVALDEARRRVVLINLLISFIHQGDEARIQQFFQRPDAQVLDLNILSKDGGSALHHAALFGNESLVNLLIDKGAKIDLAGGIGTTPLHCAAVKGQVAVVRLLLDKGATIDQANNNGATPLHWAAGKGHAEVVQCLLEHAANINQADNNGATPLHWAAEKGHGEVVQCLLEHEANIDQVDKNGVTALHLAAANGHVEMINWLLDKGAKIDQAATNGSRPLHLAAASGHVAAVRQLLDKTAKIDQAGKNGATALHCAAEKGHEGVVQCLLEREANIDQVDNHGATPLHYAADKGQVEMIELLLKAGAEIDRADNEGVTALQGAAVNGQVEVVRCLLQKNAKTDRADKNRRRALHWAAKKGDVDVIQLLLDNGATVDITDTHELTPLSFAAGNGQIDVILLLLGKRADIGRADKNGVTALHWAATGGYVNVVELLLQNKAKTDRADNNGATPLHCAARKGHAEVVRCLLEHEANIDHADNNGVTALHCAAGKSHVEVINQLLVKGAKIDHADNNGVTALHCAAAGGYVEVVQALLANGATIDQADNNGVTALLCAAEKGHAEVVRCLLEHEANSDQANNNGVTALHWAATCGHVEMINWLLAKSATIDQADNNGVTALHWAAVNGRVEVVRLLLGEGATIDQAEKHGATPLHWAAQKGHAGVVECLLEHEAKDAGVTALHWAAQKGHAEVVRCLLKHAANIDQANDEGVTALHWAAACGHVEMVNWLLGEGATIDQADKNGGTPLHWAAANGQVGVVQLLLDNRANIDQADNNGATALHWAARNGHVAVVNWLKEKGVNTGKADNHGQTPLMVAQNSGHTDVVSALLDKDMIMAPSSPSLIFSGNFPSNSCDSEIQRADHKLNTAPRIPLR